MGKDDFTKIPNGIPSLEDRINLYFTHGVKTGRIDLHRFVETASTQAAKLFGLFPRKGAIQIGSDADLVVYDPNYRGKISAKTHQMNLDYNSFEGFEIEGRPHVVTVRGKVAARDGKFVGEAGRGKFIERELIDANLSQAFVALPARPHREANTDARGFRQSGSCKSRLLQVRPR